MQKAIDQFISYGTVQAAWSPKTVEHYTYLVDLLHGFLRSQGCTRWPDVSPADLDAFMKSLEARGLAKKTRLGAAGFIIRFSKWLQEKGIVIRNPARSLPVPDNGEEDLPQEPLSEAEVASIIESLPRHSVFGLRNVAFLELLYGCGLRSGEISRLNLDHIDLTERTVLIKNSKHNQTRMVPLMKTAQAALEDYLSLRKTLLKGPDEGALFLTQYGNRITHDTIYSWFRLLNESRGSDAKHLRPHLFRHAIAVHLLRGGADIRYIQEFLGHACLDTTKIYLKLVPGQLREDYDEAMPWLGV